MRQGFQTLQRQEVEKTVGARSHSVCVWVARVLGVSQVQVSRLEKKILKQMRERLVS